MEEEGKTAWPKPGENMTKDKDRSNSAAGKSAAQRNEEAGKQDNTKTDETNRAQELKKEQEAHKKLCKEEEKLTGYWWMKVDKLGYSQLKARKKGKQLSEEVYEFYRRHGVEIIDDAPGDEKNTPVDSDSGGKQKMEAGDEGKAGEEDKMAVEDDGEGEPEISTPGSTADSPDDITIS